MESGELTRLKRVKALSGTAFAGVELLAASRWSCWGLSAFDGAFSAPEDGVYAAAAVVALEPAEAEPDEAKDVEAPAPDAPDEELAWIYRLDSLLGSF